MFPPYVCCESVRVNIWYDGRISIGIFEGRRENEYFRSSCVRSVSLFGRASDLVYKDRWFDLYLCWESVRLSIWKLCVRNEALWRSCWIEPQRTYHFITILTILPITLEVTIFLNSNYVKIFEPCVFFFDLCFEAVPLFRALFSNMVYNFVLQPWIEFIDNFIGTIIVLKCCLKKKNCNYGYRLWIILFARALV